MSVAGKRLCIRCGRGFDGGAGRVLAEGPVCPSCARHFAPLQVCPRCARKRRIFGFDKATGERVCSNCLNAIHSATCGRCGRYRRTAGVTQNGRPLCRRCVEAPYTTHACPDCGVEVTGAGNGRCTACLSKGRSIRLAEARLPEFSTDWARDWFRGFCTWPRLRIDAPVVAGRIDRFAEVFKELEASVSAPDQIDQTFLLNRFGAEGLRRRQMVIGFLVEVVGVAWSNDVTIDFLEEKRISKIFVEAERFGALAALRSLDDSLKAGVRPIKPLTRRLYLRLMLDFALFLKPAPLSAATTPRLRAFLKRRPGQKAAIHRIARFLNEAFRIRLEPMTPPKRSQIALDRDLLRRVAALRAALREAPPMSRGRALTAGLLSELYLVPRNVVVALPRGALEQTVGGASLVLPHGRFDLDPRIAEPVLRYAPPADASFLFPGRVAGRHLTAASLTHHLRAVIGRPFRAAGRRRPPPRPG